MKKIFFIFTLIFNMCFVTNIATGATPKIKFYDFQNQLIDGEIKSPTALYIDRRTSARFNRLLKLKKSFIKTLLQTSKERVFK